MKPPFEPFIAARADKLFFYLPYYFIREIDASVQMREYINKAFEQDAHQQIIAITTGKEAHYFFVKYLSWDSDFFGRPVYKLTSVLFGHQNYQILKKAIQNFKQQFFENMQLYCFIEIPAEDTMLVQALNANGFIMVETRLTYYRTVSDFNNERYAVRKAAATDRESIKRVATITQNPYDRFHAEPAILQSMADAFLGKYAEEAVKGYCDAVIVPAEVHVPAEAFLALGHIRFNYMKNDSQGDFYKISNIVLSAVAPACKGWHFKLVSEAIYMAQAEGSKYIVMTTQAINKAVIHNCEKLGFKMGSSRYILSYTTAT